MTTTTSTKRDKNLRVSSQTDPASLAGSITYTIRDHGSCTVQAIGAGAINQAVKAIAIARGYMAPQGHDLICIPSFKDVQIDGDDRTAIKFIIEPRR